MQKKSFFLTTILFLSIAFNTFAQPTPTPDATKQEVHQYGEIDSKGLMALINAGVPLVIFDSRAAKYDDGKRIPGAKLVPYNLSVEQMQQYIPAKESLIVTYCTSARCPLSKLQANKLIQQGYPNVIKYPGGIEEWVAEGNRYETSKK